MSMAIIRSNADLKTNELLGFLVFPSISDLRIHRDDLANIFEKNGLDTKKFLPDKIYAHDAFRRASKAIESTVEIKNPTGGKGRARILVREVKSDKESVVRHVVRELINDKDERLDYNTVGRLILNRDTETLSYDWDHKYLGEYGYDGLILQASWLFREWLLYHNRETVTNITRRVINAMNHVSLLKNGRATFIPRNHRETLEGLAGMIEDLKPYHKGDHSVIEIIPVIDTVEQREMIARRIEADIDQDANQLLADFAELLQSDKVSMRAVRGYAERFVELQMKLEEYEDLVHRKMETLHLQLAESLQRIKEKQEELSQ